MCPAGIVTPQLVRNFSLILALILRYRHSVIVCLADVTIVLSVSTHPLVILLLSSDITYQTKVLSHCSRDISQLWWEEWTLTTSFPDPKPATSASGRPWLEQQYYPEAACLYGPHSCTERRLEVGVRLNDIGSAAVGMLCHTLTSVSHAAAWTKTRFLSAF